MKEIEGVEGLENLAIALTSESFEKCTSQDFAGQPVPNYFGRRRNWKFEDNYEV